MLVSLTDIDSKLPQSQVQILTERGVAETFPHNAEENLASRIAAATKPLRVKLGIDPTRPDLHLGHTVALRKLRQFQDAGHIAVLIIGDFTAQIGDPTGKSEARPRLTIDEVNHNAKTYLDQARKVLDFDTPGRLELRYNSEWLNDLSLHSTINLLASMTVGQMLAKEGFANRYEKNTPIYLHEFLYPLMQGYDSVVINADVELGGTDQKFNILVGRDLQIDKGNSGQFGLLLPLLVGLDGVQKMSKSLDNYVGLTEDPWSMYSKLQKVPDALVNSYFELLTDVDLSSLPSDARERQKQLALTIVGQYHSPEAALQAQQDAEKIVLERNTQSLGEIPEFALAEINFPTPLFYLLKASGLCKSNNEAQSQIKNGAVRIDGEKVQDVELSFETAADLQNKVLQVGKKKFLRLV